MSRSTLRNVRVRQLVVAFASITLAEWVLGTTVAVHAYAVGGALAVGLVGFRFVPAALAGLWTTRLSDHAQRHRVLTLVAAGRAGATGLAVVALALHVPFAIVIALLWLDAAIGSAYRPAQAAMLPALVRTPGELTAATAMISNVKTSGQLVGALLGGLLVAALPIPVPVAVAAFLYLIGMALTATGIGIGSMATRSPPSSAPTSCPEVLTFEIIAVAAVSSPGVRTSAGTRAACAGR